MGYVVLLDYYYCLCVKEFPRCVWDKRKGERRQSWTCPMTPTMCSVWTYLTAQPSSLSPKYVQLENLCTGFEINVLESNCFSGLVVRPPPEEQEVWGMKKVIRIFRLNSFNILSNFITISGELFWKLSQKGFAVWRPCELEPKWRRVKYNLSRTRRKFLNFTVRGKDGQLVKMDCWMNRLKSSRHYPNVSHMKKQVSGGITVCICLC